MTTKCDGLRPVTERQTGETEEWYDRFRIYLYMGPDRTLAAAHALASRLAKGAAHGQLSSWRRAAKRYEWQGRAAAYDAELCRTALASDERLMMVAELLQQVYGVLRQADILALSKEEARRLLPTFRLFFRDLLQFHQIEAAHHLTTKRGASKKGTQADTELSADDLMKFLTETGGWQTLLAEIERVTDTPANESSWLPLRDLLARFYPDEASARRMVDQAHLDSTRIPFASRALDIWHAILTEATHAGRMEQLIHTVQKDYGANHDLAAAVQKYRQARGQEHKTTSRRET